MLKVVASVCTRGLFSRPRHSEFVRNYCLVQCEDVDKLYKALIVEVRGHDKAVLNSYESFVRMAANELSINLKQVCEPKVNHERRTLLKSVHIYKKHRVQYEFRTYFRLFELKQITGSTADTFLEYIQRNLPEGVAMKVTKHAIEKINEHIAL